MKRTLFALFLLAGAFLAGADHFVFLAPDATAAEENAARELVNGLHRIFAPFRSSYMFAVSRKEPEKCLFQVGQSKAAAQALGMKDFSSLKPDEILLRKVNGKMILLGDRPRGTLYAVYEFLERAYGVRFWTAEAEFWPRYEKFFLPEIAHRYAPVFRRRYVYYDLSRKSPFCVKLRTNRYWAGPKWGGTEEIIGFCHTFGLFVPAKKHFKDHPEWFAVQRGKRVPNGQPCLTNRGFRKALIDTLVILSSLFSAVLSFISDIAPNPLESVNFNLDACFTSLSDNFIFISNSFDSSDILFLIIILPDLSNTSIVSIFSLSLTFAIIFNDTPFAVLIVSALYISGPLYCTLYTPFCAYMLSITSSLSTVITYIPSFPFIPLLASLSAKTLTPPSPLLNTETLI